MEKQVVIEYQPKELKEIIGVELVMDFDDFQIDGKDVSEEKVDSYEEMIIAYTKEHKPELFDEAYIGCYSRIFSKGLSAIFKSNQKMYGSVTIVYPETAM